MKTSVEKSLTITLSEKEAKDLLFFVEGNKLTDYGILEEICDFIIKEFPQYATDCTDANRLKENLVETVKSTDAELQQPVYDQFMELKEKHPDAMILMRCGDFYETYAEDAKKAAEILGITLTRKKGKKGKSMEMAGFPYHALDTYLPKLIRNGVRVAIADEIIKKSPELNFNE